MNKKIKSLSTVLVPMTSREMFQLELLFGLWRLWHLAGYRLSKRASNKELVISFDCAFSHSLEDQVVGLYRRYLLDLKFSKLEIVFCDIPKIDNVYVKKNDPIPDVLPRLGYASGPNTQFFHTMRELRDREYVFLNETDCVPICVDWLEKLGRRVFWNESFWVMGSSYKGITELGSDISNHVNGNAIYASGCSEFQLFLDEWETGLSEAVKQRNFMAYDVYLAYKEHMVLNSTENRSGELKKIRKLKSKFVYSDLILNSSANQDVKSLEGVNDARSSSFNDETCVCHGRHFVLQSYELVKSELSRKSFNHNRQDISNLVSLRKRLADEERDGLGFVLKEIENILSENQINDDNCASKSCNFAKDNLKNLKTKNDQFFDENIIFLLGNPRSGTTLLQKLISTSSSVETTGEPWLQLFLLGGLDTSLVHSKFDQKLMLSALSCVEKENNRKDLLKSLLKEVSLKYYSEIKNSINPSAKYFMDKTPRYSTICDKIVLQHPESKYILITRNPFDIACSVITAWTGGVDHFLNIESLKADFEVGLLKLSQLIEKPPNNFLLCDYETLTHNTFVELGRIAEFLDLPIEEFSLDYSKTSRKFEFGDDRQVDSQTKAVKNINSWKSALGSHRDYLKLKTYLESLPSDVLSLMQYNAPDWIG